MVKVLLGLIVVVLLLVLLLRGKKPEKQDVKPGRQHATGKRVKSPPVSKRTSQKVALKAPQQQKPSSSRAASSDYRAVTVKTRLGACNAAIALQDQIFLAREAPSLPLAECDVGNCACRYRYLDDRRQDDRRTPYGLKHGAVVGGTEGNRRDPGDRRK
jgi:hypothetical protein